MWTQQRSAGLVWTSIMRSVIKTSHPPSTVRQANFNVFPVPHTGSRTSVQKKNCCTNTQQGLNLSTFRSGSSQTNPDQSDSFITLCQAQPPQHDMPAPDQPHRSKLCRKTHLNSIWAAHLLSLTVTEEPKTWFQSAPVTPSIDLGRWHGRIYPNSRKERRTEAQERFEDGEIDKLSWFICFFPHTLYHFLSSFFSPHKLPLLLLTHPKCV